MKKLAIKMKISKKRQTQELIILFLIILFILVLIGNKAGNNGADEFANVETVHDDISDQVNYNSLDQKKGRDENKASVFVNGIKKEIGVDFLDIGEKKFDWVVEEGDVIKKIVVPGIWIEAKNVSDDQRDKIKLFFEKKNFELSDLNAHASDFVLSNGYKKDDVVCIISERMRLEESGMPSEIAKTDVEVKCGSMSDSDLLK